MVLGGVGGDVDRHIGGGTICSSLASYRLLPPPPTTGVASDESASGVSDRLVGGEKCVGSITDPAGDHDVGFTRPGSFDDSVGGGAFGFSGETADGVGVGASAESAWRSELDTEEDRPTTSRSLIPP